MPDSAGGTSGADRDHLYGFGRHVVDLDRELLLTSAGQALRLRPKSFAVLRYLVEHHGRLVTKEELLQVIWKDAFVTEGSLTQCVIDIRRALGSDGAPAIRTVPRRGYIFDVPVRRVAAATAPVRPAATAPQSRPRRSWIVAGGGALVLMVSILLTISALRTPHQVAPAVAVLPLVTVTGDLDQQFFADAMMAELIDTLAMIDGLQVTSRTSAMAYRGLQKTPPEIGRELGVGWLVEGTFERRGDRIRGALHLVGADTGKIERVWPFEARERDARTTQKQLAVGLAEHLGVALTPTVRTRLTLDRPVHPEAFALIARGRAAEDRGSEAALHEAIGYFQHAIDLDSSSAQAYAGLADAYYGLSGFYNDPREVLPQARAAAIQALRLEPDLADPHGTLGIIHVVLDWDREAAEREFRTALRLNPTLPRTRLLYAAFLTTQFRQDDAVREVRQALRHDPRSVRSHTLGAINMLFARRYDEAIAIADRAIALYPDAAFAMAWRGVAYSQKQQHQLALDSLRRAAAIDASPTILAVLATVEAAAGNTARARTLLGQVEAIASERYFCPYEVGSVYAVLNDADTAMRYFEKGAAERADCMPWLGVEPWTDAIRKDPRYWELLHAIGLAPRTTW